MDNISNYNLPPFPNPAGDPQLHDKNGYSFVKKSSQPVAASREDKVTLTQEGVEASAINGEESSSTTRANTPPASASSSDLQLSAEEMQQVIKLTKRDTEVKAHEHAHLSTAGQYAAGGASFTFEVGPDGKRYAVGGEVPIDMSKESTPEATIQKMQIVARAALAPASPSSADRRIASQAVMLQAQARAELQGAGDSEHTISAAAENDQGTATSGDAPREEEKISPAPHTSTSGYAISPNSRQMVLNAYALSAV